MKDLLCLFGHKWKNFGKNFSKAIALGHLHPQAGHIDLCVRCGRVWDDFGFWHNTDRIETKDYHHKAAQQIRDYASCAGLKLKGDYK